MIEIHKYLNLDLSVIHVSFLIIKELKQRELVKYDDLLHVITLSVSDKVKEVFPYALNFLYLLGKISYLSELDAFKIKNDHM